MKWKKIAAKVAQFAPAVGGALGGPLGGVVGSVVASTLGVEADPDKVLATLESSAEARVKLRQLETDLAREEMQTELEAQRIVNQTMAVEYGTASTYKSGWRPFYGWSSAFTMTLLKLGFVFLLVQVGRGALGAEGATALTSLVGAMMPIVLAELTVLGVNISARSRDKASLLGIDQRPAWEKLIGAWRGNGGTVE